MSDMIRNAKLLTCREMARMFTDYLEDALPQVERLRFEEHLSLCDGCTDYLDQLRDVVALAGGLEPDALPDELRDSVMGTFELWNQGREE